MLTLAFSSPLCESREVPVFSSGLLYRYLLRGIFPVLRCLLDLPVPCSKMHRQGLSSNPAKRNPNINPVISFFMIFLLNRTVKSPVSFPTLWGSCPHYGYRKKLNTDGRRQVRRGIADYGPTGAARIVSRSEIAFEAATAQGPGRRRASGIPAMASPLSEGSSNRSPR